jgi:hypothetical protein
MGKMLSTDNCTGVVNDLEHIIHRWHHEVRNANLLPSVNNSISTGCHSYAVLHIVSSKFLKRICLGLLEQQGSISSAYHFVMNFVFYQTLSMRDFSAVIHFKKAIHMLGRISN